MVFNPNAADEIGEREPLLKRELARSPSPPLYITTYSSEMPMDFDPKNPGASWRISSKDDPNAMTIAEFLNELVDQGYEFPDDFACNEENAAIFAKVKGFDKVPEGLERARAVWEDMNEQQHEECMEILKRFEEEYGDELPTNEQIAAIVESVVNRPASKGKARATSPPATSTPATTTAEEGPSRASFPRRAPAVIDNFDGFERVPTPPPVAPRAATNAAEDLRVAMSKITSGAKLTDREISEIAMNEERAAEEKGEEFNFLGRVAELCKMNLALELNEEEQEKAAEEWMGRGDPLKEEMESKMSRQEKRAAERKAKKEGEKKGKGKK